jgi:hypothetical protein
VASVWLWLRALMWKLPLTVFAFCILLTWGSFPAVQGIKLQQLSLLVAALLAGAAACAASGYLFLGGALLALATIKPQLAWALAAWLLLWAMSDWRRRRALVFGFATVMVLLLAGAEIILPGWWRMFAEAVRQYHQYTQNKSVLEVTLNAVGVNGTAGHVGGQILAAVAVIACAAPLWKFRREPAGGDEFGCATALVMALTVVVVPMYAPYNQVLLLPVIFVLVRDRETFLSQSRSRRMAYSLGVFLVAWQWIASLGLTVTYFLISQTRALEGWKWPFFATFALPVWSFALIFLNVKDVASRMREGRGLHFQETHGQETQARKPMIGKI